MAGKILTLNPPFLSRYSRQSRSPCTARGGTLYYAYYLAYATGSLEKMGFKGEVKLIDAVANGWNLKETKAFIEFFNPALIIMDTSTPSIYNDLQVAADIKDILPESHINLVGVHPSKKADETFSLSTAVDSICRGEFDYTVVDLARSIRENRSLKAIKGLSFREDKRIVHNSPREPIGNLDELPFVSEVYKRHFGIKGIKKYFYASLKHPQLTILTARGCPYNCSFCNIPFKASYRYRSPENVIKEFEYIRSELPEVKEVMIEDDTFPILKDRTLSICNIMKEKNMNISWSCNARVNTDFETLKVMKEAGCRLLCVGFESPVQSILNSVHKGITAELQLQFMSICRTLGLLVNGCFILGMPGDTKETIMKTIEFAKKLNPDTVQFYSTYAYPGTEIWDWAKKNSYLVSEKYSDLLTEEGYHKGNVELPGLSTEEIDEMCRRALRDFYIRKEYVLYKLKQIIMDFDELKRTLISLRVFSKHLLP